MGKKILICWFFLPIFSLDAQNITLSNCVYIYFAKNSSTELYNQYSYKIKKNKAIINKTQYIYNLKTKKLVVKKIKNEIPAWDLPENFQDYQFSESCECGVVRVYHKPTHDFKLIRNKVHTHLGYVLNE